MSGIVAYIVVFLFIFFAASLMVARYGNESPTEPPTFLALVAASLLWPITLPLTMVIILLIFIAKLAVILSGGAK